jgi:oligopeptide/dipeptide ABC transporter ATP-binding protein
MASLNPVRTVGSQLVEAWRSVFASRPSERELLDALAHVELRDRTILTCYSHQLSGGMRQRVVIAMAILGRPHLLIADEPTTALDVTVQREIMQVISNLRREMGMSVILVTHDLATVEAEADDLTILYAGMTVESGPTSLVIDRPTHPYTMALLDSRLIHAVPGQRLKAIPGSPPTPQAWPPGCRFADRCSHAIEPCRLLVPEESAWGDAISRCHRTKEITGG